MKKLCKLAGRFLNRETILYLVFGVLTTVVNYVVYYPCRYLGLHYQLCNVISWVAAVAFAYITNKLLVFESRAFAPAVMVREIVLFAGARIFSLLCEMLLMWVGVDVLGFHDYMMKLAAAVLVVVINYVFSKLLIFKKKETSK